MKQTDNKCQRKLNLMPYEEKKRQEVYGFLKDVYKIIKLKCLVKVRIIHSVLIIPLPCAFVYTEVLFLNCIIL